MIGYQPGRHHLEPTAALSSSPRLLFWLRTLSLAPFLASAALQGQTAHISIPELHTTATLTFEPVPGSPPPDLAGTFDPATTKPSPAIAVTIDCLGHHERFLRTPDHAILPIPRTDKEETETGIPQRVRGLQKDPSRLFFTTTGPRTLLFFLSPAEASDPGALYVLGFLPDGAPYRVLVSASFDLEAIDYGPGSTLRIIGKPTLSQEYGNDDAGPKAPMATTYDPYTVYVVQGDSPAVASLPLSKAYNLKHYVWAGPRMSEKIAVLYNIPGHPKPFVALDSEVPDLIARAEKARQKHP